MAIKRKQKKSNVSEEIQQRARSESAGVSSVGLVGSARGESVVVPRAARTYRVPEGMESLLDLPEVVYCSCPKVEVRGRKQAPAKKDCRCGARRWSRTSKDLERSVVEDLGQLQYEEKDLTGALPKLEAYMLKAFADFLPSREEGLARRDGLARLLGDGEVPEPVETVSRTLRWPLELEKACRGTARRLYVSGRGLGQAMVPASWFYSEALRRFIEDRRQRLKDIRQRLEDGS